MAQKIELLIPLGERPKGQGEHRPNLAARLSGLEGKTIGIFSNSWKCMTYVADEFRQRLADFGVKEVIQIDAPTTAALSAELMQQAAAKCDAAIVGMGT